MATISKGLGRLALFTATAAFLTTVSLFLLGAYLLTWPILRKSPREQRIRATAELAASVVTAIAVFGDRPDVD